MSAATDNVGLFFGEDIFFAIGSIVLIQATLATYGYDADAARTGALGDPHRDRRLPDPRLPVVAVRALARQAGGRTNDHLHWLYIARRRDVRGLRDASARSTAPTQKRFGNAAFWGLMAVSLLARRPIGDLGNGLLVLGAGRARRVRLPRSQATRRPPTSREREAWSARLGNRLFLPALIIPATALVGTLAYNYTPLGRCRLDRAQARNLRLPRARRAARAGGDLRSGCARPRSPRCRKGGG